MALSCTRVPSARTMRRQALMHERALWKGKSCYRGSPPVAAAGNGPVTTAGNVTRVGTVKRKTKETSVEVTINLDGTGQCTAETPVGFLNHMLDQIASHGLFDLTVKATGDTWIDDHHTVEDIALALGGAFSQALGDRKGIHRFGEFSAPLDEALTHVVLDLSGRPHLAWDVPIPTQRIGTFDTQLVEHFFQSFSNTSGVLTTTRASPVSRGCQPARQRRSRAAPVLTCVRVCVSGCLRHHAARSPASGQELASHCGGHLQGLCTCVAVCHRV